MPHNTNNHNTKFLITLIIIACTAAFSSDIYAPLFPESQII